eukprot:g25177.t1
MAVTVVVARQAAVTEQIPVVGTLAPEEEIQVRPLVQNRALQHILAEVGQHVEKGRPLAVLDMTDALLLLAKNSVSILRAKAAVSVAESRVEVAAVTEAEATSTLARSIALQPKGAVAQQVLDQHRNAHARAVAEVGLARQSLVLTQAEVDLVAREREEIELTIERSTVRAPDSGFVLSRSARIGAIASEDGEPLFVLARDSAVELVAQVTETIFTRLRQGMPAHIILPGRQDPVAGRVRLRAARIDAATRSGEVRIALDREEEGAIPGMFAHATIETSSRRNILLPQTAVESAGGAHSVFVVRNGVVEPRQVTVGVRQEGFVEISKGIDEGEMVVLKSGGFLKPQERQSGATPVELETEVTRLIENAVASLPAIKELASTISDGRSVTTIEFELGLVTPDRAMDDVRDAVSRIRGDLPGTIDEPVIERVEEEAQSIVTYAVASRDQTIAELSWFVDDEITRQMQGLPGVGRVERIGGADREIHIELDANRLQALSLSAAGVNEIINQTQIDRSGGRSEVAGREQVLTTAAAPRTVADLAEQRLALAGDASVRLADVATIRDTTAEPRAYATFAGNDVVGFSIYRTQEASDIAVAGAVANAVTEMAASRPDVQFIMVDENVSYTAGNYRSAVHTLLEGAALSVVVVFLFLRDWRATVVAAAALPLSIIPTFFALHVMGFSLNILSLLAITLVTGILVDDAIVEIENVVRHRNMGKSAYRAALDASDEIGLAVIAISGTIIAVFAPVGLMSGVVGLYFREFGLTVAVAVFFSLLVARLITPIMAAYFMTGRPPREMPHGWAMRSYESLLRVSLRWKMLTIALAAALFAVSVASLASVPTTFLPEEDTGRLMLTVELPPGATLSDTRGVTNEISARALQRDEVEGVLARAGASMNGQQDVRHAVVSIDLKHKSQRERSSFAIEADLVKAFDSIPDARLRFLNNRGGRDLSFAVLGSGQAVQDAADAILREMGYDPAFRAPTSDNIAMRPELRISVLDDKAAMLGVSAAAISSTLRISTLGDVDARLANFIDASRQIPIRVVVDPAARGQLPIFETLIVPSSNGGEIPLASVAELAFDQTVASINRFNRQRRIEIEADMAAGLTSGQGLERVLQLGSVRGLPPGVTVQATGDSDTEGDVFGSFAVAMGGGIMLVLIVLVLLFGSVLPPWTILASLPLSISGVAAALFFSGKTISLPVVIGILMLMGIVTKNAIMLVDFAVEREAHGLDRFGAVVEACLERARPIIMTTLAMVGGMLPSAFGVGDGGEFRAPMAIAVIGGLLASTFLSLIVIPSLHLLVSSFGDAARHVARSFFQSTDTERQHR